MVMRGSFIAHSVTFTRRSVATAGLHVQVAPSSVNWYGERLLLFNLGLLHTHSSSPGTHVHHQLVNAYLFFSASQEHFSVATDMPWRIHNLIDLTHCSRQLPLTRTVAFCYNKSIRNMILFQVLNAILF
eukprot:scpid42858/ scgid31473/ 